MSEGWEIVETVGTESEAALIAGFLESRGLTAQIESLLFHQEPVTFGRRGEVRVRVRSEDAETARRLLAERRLRFGIVRTEGEMEAAGEESEESGPADLPESDEGRA
jgi:hypothetical protein